MNKFYKFFITSIITSLLCISAVPAQVLSVPLVTQEQDQWCWAGVSKCMLNYYTQSVQQCEIAEYTRTVSTWHNFGTANCCIDPYQGCNYWNYFFSYEGSVQDILTHFKSLVSYPANYALTTSEIQTEISHQRPFFIRWGWRSGGGHFVVGHGINGDNINYMNPWPGEGLKIATYSWLVDDGNHTWTHSLKMATNPTDPTINCTVTSGSTYCVGQPVNINYTVSSDFYNGNTFSAQLSDPYGSFNNPIEIGWVQRITSGVISTTIPKNIPGGNFYRIRVSGSNPPINGSDNGSNIVINLVPLVDINGNKSVCQNAVESYTTPLASNTSYQWYVMGGTILNGEFENTVNIKWGSSGTGILKIVGASLTTGCKDSVESLITINNLPAVAFNGNTKVCTQNHELYTTTKTAGHTYKWNISGGTILGNSSTDTLRVIWGAPGTGSVKLTETIDATLCNDTLLKTITIRPLPQPQIFGQWPVCERDTLLYNAQKTTGNSYFWRIIGGFIIGPANKDTVKFAWGMQGNGSIILQMTNDTTGCQNTDTVAVQIFPKEKPIISGKTNLYQNDTITYRVTSNLSSKYKWTATNGVIAGLDQDFIVKVKWIGPGKGTIKLVQTADPAGCKDSSSLDITINPLNIPYINGKNKICANQTTNYYTNFKSGNSYKWTVSGGMISGVDNIDSVRINWGNSGIGIVKIMQTNSNNGRKDSTMLNVSIGEIPNPNIQGANRICIDDVFIYTTSLHPLHSYRWYVSPGTIIGNNTYNTVQIKCFAEGRTTLKVIETVDSSDCKDSAAIVIDVFPAPVKPLVTRIRDSLISNYQTGNQWYKNDNPITGAKGQIYHLLYNEVGRFKVKITDVNGCRSPFSDSIDVVTGITEELSGKYLKVLPNPASDILTAYFTLDNDSKISIRIANSMGEILPQFNVIDEGKKGENKISISSAQLSSGVYFMLVNYGGVTGVTKFLILK